MSKRSEHYQVQADAHGQLARNEQALSECFGKMAGAASEEDAPIYKAAQAHHASNADMNAGLCEHFEACAKAVEDELGKTLVPDGFTSVFPSDVPAVSKVRMVPRGGQPDVDLASVPEQFRHLVQNPD
jgi:hypothetical protein